jgi:hypothetical protein
MTESQVGRHQVGRHHEVTVACSPPSSRTSSSIRLLQEHHLRLPRPQVQGHRPQGVVRDAVNGVAVKPTGKTFALNIGALPCAPKATPTPYPADRADAPHVRQDDAHHLLRRRTAPSPSASRSAGRPPHADRPQAALHHAQPHPCWWASSTRPITSA